MRCNVLHFGKLSDCSVKVTDLANSVVAADNCGWPRVSWTLGLHPVVGEEVRVTPEYATLPSAVGPLTTISTSRRD